MYDTPINERHARVNWPLILALLFVPSPGAIKAETVTQHSRRSWIAVLRSLFLLLLGFALAGGGKDLDAVFQWLIKRSGGGDIVVVRASGTDAYNPYIQKLGQVNSVETLIVKTPEAARSPYVLDKIRHAD